MADDPRAAALELVEINKREIQPFYSTWKAGAIGDFFLGTYLGGVTGSAIDAGRAYANLAAKWYDVAQRIMQQDDGSPPFDLLSLWLDQTLRQRREITDSGIDLASPLSAGLSTFVAEVSARLDAFGGFALSIGPSAAVGAGAIVVLVVVVLLLR